MAIKNRICVNHPLRAAIGICVITKAAICGECSTRYEGVNYSKEGLEILHKQRKSALEKPKRGVQILVWVLSPGLLYLVYLSYWMLAELLMNMLHRDVQPMGSANNRAVSLAMLLEVGGSSLTPLDAAADYWRSRVSRLLPLYVLAMLPHAVVAAFLISAINGERRTLARTYCIYMTAATIWRWVWISRLQHGVQEELRAQLQPKFWSRLPQILMIRLVGNVCICWGIVLAGVPVFYGIFLTGFAAPLVLESDDPAISRVGQATSWIHHSGKRLLQMLSAITVITLLLLVAIFASQFILSRTILPSFLAMDTADLNLTLNGWAWRLSLCYFVFLVIDAFWSVASVLIYYDSQSRRTATDLKSRLMVMTGGAV